MSKSPLLYDANGRLRSLWRLLAFFALSFVFVVLASSIVVAAYGGTPPRDVLGIVLIQWATVGGLVLAHLVIIRTIDRRPWTDLGLGSEQARPPYAILGIAVGALAIAAAMGVLFAIRWLRVDAAPQGSSISFALVMLALFVPAAFVEELAFRGYAFRVLRDAWGWVPAAIVTSVVFAALHAYNPNGCVATWRAGSFDAQTCGQSLVLVTLAGVFLAAVLVYTGSLYAAWAAHFAWNWMMTGVLHAAVSGASEPLPGVSIPDFRIVDNGPDLVTGGPWGPEGGLMAAVAIGASMVILKRVTDRRREREAVT